MDEFGMDFPLSFFKHKKGWIPRYVFHMFTGCEFLTKNGWIPRYVFYMFTGCEFLTKNGWISRYVFHLFMGCEFPTKKGWILWYIFHLFIGWHGTVYSSWKWLGNSLVIVLISQPFTLGNNSIRINYFSGGNIIVLHYLKYLVNYPNFIVFL